MSTTTARSAIETPATVGDLPPLKQGQRLTREEFERRYDAMPELKKAELIEGVVYMPSPVRTDQHGEPHSDMVGWAATYRRRTPGIRCSDNGSTRLDPNNMPQPDIQIFLAPECGGQARVGKDGYVEGAAEMVVEVSASTTPYDLREKLNTYQRHKVQEYVVWRVEEQQVDWFRLRDGKYERVPPDSDGIYRSACFPGLWLDAEALVRGDLDRFDKVLSRGLRSPDHAAFVKRNRAALKAARHK